MKMVTCRHQGCRRSKDLRHGLCPEHGGTEEDMSDPSLASFPSATMAAVPPLDMGLVNSVVDRVFRGGEGVSTDDFQKAMLGMLFNNMNKINSLENKVENTANHAKTNEERIKALEEKVGDKGECAIPLSITIQNLPINNEGGDDETSVKTLIKEINPEGVNVDTDVMKVMRKGYKPAIENKTEKLGVVMVELRNSEVKAKIMKTKKNLAHSAHEVLRNIRIGVMKTQDQVNQERFNRQLLRLVPGGDQFYLTGSGAIRPQTRPWAPRHPGPRAPGGHPGPSRFQHAPPNPQHAPNLQPNLYHQAPLFQPLTQPSSQPPLAPLPGLHPPAPGVYSQRPPVLPSTNHATPATFSFG